MPPLGLNVFQRIMRLWDRVHPYNAAQVMRLTAPIDPRRWGDAWRETRSTLRLGIIRFTGDRYTHEPTDDPAAEALVLEPSTDLTAWLSDELNRPFPMGDEVPFRAFVLPRPSDAQVGIVYHHWAADSASIRSLLGEWFFTVHDPSRRRHSPPRHPSGGFWHHFGPGPAGWDLFESALSLLRLRTRFATVRKVRFGDADRWTQRFSVHAIPPQFATALFEAAGNLGCTTNDLFTAAVAEACDRHLPGVLSDRDGDLAIGTIADIRRYSRHDLDQVFGMFLGFTTTVLRAGDLCRWDRLLQSVAAQSRLHRLTRAAPASVLRMGVAVAESRFYDPRAWSARYRRQMPMSAGLSNVNLTGSWANDYPDLLSDYLRVSPTGPLLPIVFTPTTMGGKMNLGVTCLSQVIDARDVNTIVSAVIDRLGRVVCADR